MLLIWGTRDQGVPRGWIDADQTATSGAKGATIAGARQQPEIEREEELSRAINQCLS
jgi:hypothetical protein